jgi:hypothetical protein
VTLISDPVHGAAAPLTARELALEFEPFAAEAAGELGVGVAAEADVVPAWVFAAVVPVAVADGDRLVPALLVPSGPDGDDEPVHAAVAPSTAVASTAAAASRRVRVTLR